MKSNRSLFVSFSIRLVLIATLAIVANIFFSPLSESSPFQANIGTVWRVTEYGGWTATWTRRGDSLVFDGSWVNGGQKVAGVLTMSVQGRTVLIQSRQQTNGYDVDYDGTISQDGRSVQGTLRVLRSGTTANWQATIETSRPETKTATIAAPPATTPTRLDIGRTWRVTEYGGWTATWTRRGSSQIFDGVWLNGGQKVTGVLTMTVEGRSIRIQSRQQTNGYNVDYEGTIAPDGRTVQGTLRVLGSGTAANWQAVIDAAGSDTQTGASAGTVPSGTPNRSIDLNGSWSNGLLHIWQDGTAVLVTATWKRNGEKWVIFRGEGHLSGRELVFKAIYSPMAYGRDDKVEAHYQVSDDGNIIYGVYYLDGQRLPKEDRTYYRDK